jgi:hypothetical protein
MSWSLCAGQILHISAKLFVNLDLNEFFQTGVLVRLRLKLNVVFVRDNQGVLWKLWFIWIQLFLKQWNLAFSVFVRQVTQLSLMPLLELSLLKVEVLFLRLNNNSELGLFGLSLLNKPFKLRNLFKVLYLLVCNFLVQHVLLFLASHALH